MSLQDRIVKPKTHRGKRILKKREPKVHEHAKQAMFIRGATASNISLQFMKDVYMLKRMQSTLLGNKNDYNPFENVTPIEGLAQKHDMALFSFCSHNKKRPNNVIFGRLYDYHLLDMVEFGLEEFKSLSEFKGSKISMGAKPCLVFAGEPWRHNPELCKIKNLFIDFFRGEVVDQIRLVGFEHVLVFTAAEGKIFFRSYKILLNKSGTKTPRVELEEIGPSANLVVRRSKLASADLFKTACRQPVQLMRKKVKNITKDAFGSRLGRIHMPRQDYKKLQVRRGKALRPEKKQKKTGKS